MTVATLLARVRELASAGSIRVTSHAREKMRPAPLGRGVTMGDLRAALLSARSCQPGTDHKGTWIISGDDLDNEPLTLVAQIQEAIIVITLF